MGGRQKVKSFEQIRLGYAAGETINGLAKKHGVHRRDALSLRALAAEFSALKNPSAAGSSRWVS
jgi:hypothetical protein